MMFRVGIEKTTNHALVLGVVLFRFALEELDAALAQGERDFHAFFTKDEVFGSRKKIRDHPWLTHRLIRVSYFRAHKPTPCLRRLPRSFVAFHSNRAVAMPQGYAESIKNAIYMYGFVRSPA